MIEITIVSLVYNHAQSDFQIIIPPTAHVPIGYEGIAAQIDRKDAEIFINKMHLKYVKGRKSGRFPSTEIVKLELELFMKLKDYKQKLV